MTVEAEGSGSKIDLSDLTSFAGTGTSGEPILIDTTQATVLDPDLTTLTGASLQVDGTGTISLNQITSVTDAFQLEFTGGSYTLPNLADLDSSNVLVESGATVDLSGITSYANLTTFDTTTFEATGTGSILNLPKLASLGTVSSQLQIEALQGGQTLLPVLTQVTSSSPNVQFDAQGTGGEIDLTDLGSFARLEHFTVIRSRGA